MPGSTVRASWRYSMTEAGSKNNEQPLPYGRQWLDEHDIEAVLDVLRGDWLTTGPSVARFESELARKAGVRHAVAVNSGTAALHTMYAAAEVGPGDEIVTSPLTFVATASMAMLLGATVRFADIEDDTGCIDPQSAEGCLGPSAKLLVAVDYAGHPADYDGLRRIASARQLGLVSDAAHSFGATFRQQPIGAVVDACSLSFHPVKTITTGEGGAVLTNDSQWQERALAFRNHGIVRESSKLENPGAAWYYEVQSLGLNYRIPDILCVLGLSQLDKLERFLERRRTIAATYQRAFAAEPGLIVPTERPNVESSWHLYVLRVRDSARRDAFFEYLRSHGIGAQVHYLPVYLHPVFSALGYRRGACPKAEDFTSKAVSIPLYPKMSDDDVERVIATVADACRSVL